MSAVWSASARVVLAATPGASAASSASASVAARATFRCGCVCAALFSTSTRALVEEKSQRRSGKYDAQKKPPRVTRKHTGPSRHDVSQDTEPDAQPTPKGVKGIEYINAERTWGGTPVPLYTSGNFFNPPAPANPLSSTKQKSKEASRHHKNDPAVVVPGTMHASEAMRRSDPTLLQLTSVLTKISDSGNLIAIIKICHAIKDRLGTMAAEKHASKTSSGAPGPTIIYPPPIVFEKMLKAFAMYGDVAACNSIADDMRAIGWTLGMEQLDWLLLAAVQSGDHEEVDTVLERIADLNRRNDSEASSLELTRDEPKAEIPSSAILSTEYMRNWTPTTYRHMLTYCSATKNLEYGLALLGAATQRSKAEASKVGDASNRAAFIRQILTPTTVQCVLQLALDSRQARLATDLAVWMDSGAAARKMDLQTWMAVLRCCAEEDYFPGVALTWKEGVERGMVQPDEGLLLAVLNCASRGRRSAFIKRALETFERQAPSTFTLQEWHLMPLFEAQCFEHDFDAAMQTATRMALVTDLQLRTPPPIRLLALLHLSSVTPRDMISAYYAFLRVGRANVTNDERAPPAVTTETMNVLIRAANALGMHNAALKVYGLRHYLRNERTPLSMRLPVLPKMYGEIIKSDQTTRNVLLTLEAVRGNERKMSQNGRKDDGDEELSTESAGDPPPQVTAEIWAGMGLRPDVHTINALLSTAINMKSAAVGRFALDELIAHRLEPDTSTYERAIVLAATQTRYEDAFELLENAKARSIVPTRDSYRALATRCRLDEDERWIKVVQEMVSHGQWPGRDLSAAYVKAGYPDPSTRHHVERN